MWVVTTRGKYYTVMAETVWAALCRMEEAEGKKPPCKLGEAPTHAEAEALVAQLKKAEQEGKQHAGSGEVSGRETGAGETRVEEGHPPDPAAAGNAEAVSGDGDRAPVGDAAGKPGGATPAPVNRLDAGQHGVFDADWAQEDVLVTAREGGDGMPVFTGELFLRKWPREAKIIVNLRFAHGFSLRDIARVVGCSPQTVSNVCRSEVSSRPADQFRKAMADRLRGTAMSLLMLVEERVDDPNHMADVETKELVGLLEKTCAALRSMDAAPEGGGAGTEKNSKPARSAEEQAAKEMEELAGVYEVKGNAP